MQNLKFLITAILLCFYRLAEAQIGLGGFSGVMTIPTARMLADKHVALGVGYMPKPYALYEGSEHDNLTYFAAFGFLPFAEISLRATRSSESRHPSIGDRVANIRLQILAETPHRPGVTIGLHDVIALLERKNGSNNWFTASYIVATKKTALSKRFAVDATLGYGVDWITAVSHEFDHLFGGVSIGVNDLLFFKGEYDAKRFNYGVGCHLYKFLSANLVFMDGKKAAFGANLRKRL